MYMSIESRKLNRRVGFSRPGRGYIYVDLNGGSGTSGNQICYGGSTMGSTITYFGDDQDVFNKICSNWYRSYIKNLNENLW